ncbi:60S ribosomal protein L28 [Apophysomyces sp. BC1034]|nr:60S ribosomal protein L28 [Apophysomyces sp. BC1015]KAG0181634.1 60S ribosomal protein L28 [Apophysomyces sp. BC1021]KAG0192308.1 60S ribosomal protein L28 [Apophysomyces sp. BC1034]
MSCDLVWELVKKNNSFLVKKNGVQFSSEPNNVKNLHSYKFSGLANKKTVAIHPAQRGVRVILNTKKTQSPAKSTHSVVIAKGSRKTAKSVANLIALRYRGDLRTAALARASAVQAAAKPKKVNAQRPAKGIRAQKAAAKQA